MVVKLVILFLLCHAASAVSHSLKYLITASSGDPDISEFMFVTVVDDTEVLYCDGSKKIFEPTQDWLKKVFDDSPDFLVAFTFECFEHQPNIFKSSISHLKQLLNQSEGVYILKVIGGCEWDENSGEVKNFFQFGINGEDAFEFDLKTLTWIALKPELYYIKQILDGDTPGIKYIEEVISTFYSTLRLFWGYGSSSLNKTVVPSVSLLQKTPSSPVNCHSTGFYPDRGAMFWRKDGEEIHEGVDPGEIIPNNDETFQMSVDLNVLSVTPEDWSRYDCVFQLSGVENIITKLDRTVIRSNTRERTENPSDMSAPSIAAVVVVLACILIAATGFAVYNKKKASENSIELSVRLP